MSEPNDEDWFDATVIGSSYQEQTSTRGRWRHRPLRLAEGPQGMTIDIEERGYGEWRWGHAPKES